MLRRKSEIIFNLSILVFSVGSLLLAVYFFNARNVTKIVDKAERDKQALAAAVAAETTNVEKETNSVRKIIANGQIGTVGSDSLKAVSLARKQHFLSLMSLSPEQALKFALSTDERNQLPSEVQANVEQNITVAGKLSIDVAPGPVTGTPRRMVTVITKEGKKYTLYLPGTGSERAFTGGKAVATGLTLEDQMAVSDSSLMKVGEAAVRYSGATSSFGVGKAEAMNPFSKVLGVKTPGPADTTWYMLGKVAVGLVMPQCNGTIDHCTESWSSPQGSQRMDQVYNQVQAAMSWWADRVKEKGGQVSFEYDQRRAVPTGYEPINHPSPRGERPLWINDVMGHMGFTSVNGLDPIAVYDDWLRQNKGADWAFTVFVVDSNNSATGLFTDGSFGLAWVNGPAEFHTYDDDGYGINNLAAVIAHETGHVFGALDEYNGGSSGCTESSGYLAIPNQNYALNGTGGGGCLTNVPSIMRGGVDPYTNRQISTYAAAMIGLRTSSGNLPDPINSKPTVTLDSAPSPLTASSTFTGTANDQPFIPPSGNALMIGYIEKVQYRVNGGTWQNATPVGSSAFNNVNQKFSFVPQFTSSPTGSQLIEVQATDRFGGLSSVASMTVNFQPACTLATPGLTISPASQNGSAGSTLTYSLTLTDKDSAGCPSSQFALTTINTPSGLTVGIQTPTQTLTPGQSVSVPLTVISTSGLPSQSLTFTEKVANSTNQSYTTQASAVYKVTPNAPPICTTLATPSLTISPSSQGGVSGSSLTYELLITNNDGPSGCVSQYSVAPVNFPAGLTQSPSSITKTLVPGQNGAGTIIITSDPSLSSQSLSFTEKITNMANQSYGKEVSAIYNVTSPQPNCTRANPSLSISPGSQSGNAGSTLNYNVTLLNNDSSGCGSSQFAISVQSLPTGLTLPPNQPSAYTQTLSPSQSVTQSLSINSATSLTSPQGLTFVQKITNVGYQSYSGQGSAVYNVTIPPAPACTASCVSAVTTGNCSQQSPCKTAGQATNPLPKVTFSINSSGCSAGIGVDFQTSFYGEGVNDPPPGTLFNIAQINQGGNASVDWNFCNNGSCAVFNAGQTIGWRIHDNATGQLKAICNGFAAPQATGSPTAPPDNPGVKGASTINGDFFSGFWGFINDLMRR